MWNSKWIYSELTIIDIELCLCLEHSSHTNLPNFIISSDYWLNNRVLFNKHCDEYIVKHLTVGNNNVMRFIILLLSNRMLITHLQDRTSNILAGLLTFTSPKLFFSKKQTNIEIFRGIRLDDCLSANGLSLCDNKLIFSRPVTTNIRCKTDLEDNWNITTLFTSQEPASNGPVEMWIYFSLMNILFTVVHDSSKSK